MSAVDVIRAWKDEAYRLSLSEEMRAQLPQNPAGLIEIPDDDLEYVAGGSFNTCHTKCGQNTCAPCNVGTWNGPC